MVAMARRELSDIMGIEATPVLTRVYRWESSMPQYTVGHMDRIAEIEARVALNPGVFLIGCAYRGVGLSDCIHEGELVTEKILGYLKNSGAERK
jgi:oxygen-dependent protoporphyrinogen oxidase